MTVKQEYEEGDCKEEENGIMMLNRDDEKEADDVSLRAITAEQKLITWRECMKQTN